MSAATVKFHVSLNVSKLGNSVDFYQKLFGTGPAALRPDYAKFEIEEPPLVLSLIPSPSGAGGSLNHLGIRLPDSDALFKLQARLESAGLRTSREDGVQCCHSTQTKFWVTDPDQIIWEIYILHEGTDEMDDHAEKAPCSATAPSPSNFVTWKHRIPEPFPTRIPQDDNSVHHVTLEGTANLPIETLNLSAALIEVRRVLRPGGQISLHGLAADRPVTSPFPTLPGPAAVVQYIPVETEPMKAMASAGFVDLRYEKLSPCPYFVINGAQMREILLVGFKPGHRPSRALHQAIYLGPLAMVTDDFGNTFPRGERVSLNIHDWQSLSRGAAAGQFLLLSPDQSPGPQSKT